MPLVRYCPTAENSKYKVILGFFAYNHYPFMIQLNELGYESHIVVPLAPAVTLSYRRAPKIQSGLG